VNNVETITSVGIALGMGGDAFSQLSALHHFNDGGVRLFGLSGHVKNPGIFECAIGVTLRELIYDLGGGVVGGELLAVVPGGSSTPILRAEETVDAPDPKSPLHPWHGQSVLDVPMGVDTFRGLGTMLGTCCATVLSERACPVMAMHNLMRFYRHESCGQCTPCREGSGWLERTLDKIVAGEATIEDLDRLHEIADNIMGNTICAFGEGTAMPALGFLRKFRREFEEFVRTRGASSTRSLSL
jgi:NADH-quinone oxidoreductase subunit F